MSKIIFIGGGNIAEAIFAKISPEKLVIIEHNNDRIKYLNKNFPKINTRIALDYNCSTDDLVILAIKPQDAKETCLNIAKNIHAATVLSVMAGISILSLTKWLQTTRIIRAMPNTPSLLNMGMTGIYYSINNDNETQKKVNNIFENIGLIHVVRSEDDINKITATASSSPAYIFYFIESLINSAIKNFGFTEQDAHKITLQVLKGSIAMIEENPQLAISRLRKNVSSKGGTTAAAINVFNENNLQEVISKAEIACYNRAIELGNNYK